MLTLFTSLHIDESLKSILVIGSHLSAKCRILRTLAGLFLYVQYE